MRAIIGGQYKRYQQCALWQFCVQIHQTRSCKVWAQHTSLQYSFSNKSSQPCLTQSLNLVQPIFSICLRHKSNRTPIPSDDEESDVEDSLVVLESGPGYKDLQCKVLTLRIGAIAKVGFNISRAFADKEFFFNKYRINGEKVLKKSINLQIGDALDYIRQDSVPEYPDLVEVSRVELLDVGGFNDGTSNVTVVIRRYTKLLLPREDWD